MKGCATKTVLGHCKHQIACSSLLSAETFLVAWLSHPTMSRWQTGDRQANCRVRGTLVRTSHLRSCRTWHKNPRMIFPCPDIEIVGSAMLCHFAGGVEFGDFLCQPDICVSDWRYYSLHLFWFKQQRFCAGFVLRRCFLVAFCFSLWEKLGCIAKHSCLHWVGFLTFYYGNIFYLASQSKLLWNPV